LWNIICFDKRPGASIPESSTRRITALTGMIDGQWPLPVLVTIRFDLS
jgi:hypothetical protein